MSDSSNISGSSNMSSSSLKSLLSEQPDIAISGLANLQLDALPAASPGSEPYNPASIKLEPGESAPDESATTREESKESRLSRLSRRAELALYPWPPLGVAIDTICYGPHTSTLNLDVSTLITLISDLSHKHFEESESESCIVKWQIVREKYYLNKNSSGCLDFALYPYLCGRDLVCTKAVADRVKKIVVAKGTAVEAARARCIFAELPPKPDELKALGKRPAVPEGVGHQQSKQQDPISKARNRAVKRWAKLSMHSVPENFRIPITVVDPDTRERLDELIEARELSPLAREVMPHPLSTDRLVQTYLFGWEVGITTVTTDAWVKKALQHKILTKRASDDELGPGIHLISGWTTLFSGAPLTDAVRKIYRSEEVDWEDTFEEETT